MEKHWKSEVASILNEPLLEIINTKKGLTNRNYRVKTLNFDVIVRIPYPNATQIVHREHEGKAMRLVEATGLNLPTRHFDEKTGLKITDTVNDLLTFTEYQGIDKIERTAALMRKLHGIQHCIGADFDPSARYWMYRRQVKKPMIEDAMAETILNGITQHKRLFTLCHNDWVPGNICFTDKHDYLIDYEYAGDNDPFFDVMSFVTENDLSQIEIDCFIQAYFQRIPNDDEKQDLFNYQQFHNLLWCTWACMMYEARHDEIYLDIAKQKFTAIQ